MTTYTRGERVRLAFAGAGMAAATVVGFVGATSGAADAATVGCANGGAFAGYCGTQETAAPTPLALNTYQAAPKYGAKIWAYKLSDQNGAEDFIWLAVSGNEKEAIYAPQGVPATSGGTNLCISQPDKSAGLELRNCNRTKYQLWTATQTADGFTWTNAQFNQIMNAPGGQVTAVDAPVTVLKTQEFNFSTDQN